MNSMPKQPPAPGRQALSAIELEASLRALPGWNMTSAGGAPAIDKRWRLPDFAQAMALAHAVAELAERLDHHPDLHVGYGLLSVRWTTHDAGGVTALDFQAARDTDALAAHMGVDAGAQPDNPLPRP